MFIMKFALLTVVGFLIVNTQLFTQTINKEKLKKHVYTLADDKYEGRSIGAKGGFSAADYIVEQFNEIGIKPLGENYHHYFAFRLQQAITAEGNNIIGFIEGTHPELKKEFIVIGAHYDHVGYYYKKKSKDKIIYNGADDNASGVAAIIELAREFANNQSEIDRSIIFVAFDGEETGLNGSKWMLYDSVINPEQIKLMLSLDMIGMLSKANGLELLGAGTLKNGKLLTQQIATKHNILIKKSTNEVHNRTDTKPFGELGIPAIHFTTGTISPYHKPEDDANLLDYEGMVKITDFTFDFVLHAAKKESNPLESNLLNKKGKVKTKYFSPGIRLNTGSSWHNYPDEHYTGKKGFALQAGLYAHVKMFNRFYLQPEVLYETMASNHEKGTIRTQGLTTPVNILVRFAGNDDMDVWSYILLGGYYSLNLSGKEGSKSMDFDNVFNENEHGLNFGFVINLSKVQIGFTRKIALSNMYQNKVLGNINTNAFLFNLGMQF